ncbi:MAG: stage II sporulation protein M [Bacteroidales bacterium]|nr:stage II sporulation protein M [Bacteroidales bacterium]
MKEIVFLQRNKARWQEFEAYCMNGRRHNPDKMAELYIQITDDLAYAQTYYPGSTTTQYLNDLALKAHSIIYINKKEKGNPIHRFWKYEYPLIVFNNKKYILYSFIIFTISVLIGIVSTAYNDNFTRLVLGDRYVNMTLENIRMEDPMAVYKMMGEAEMFGLISFNNIYVAMLAFVMGAFFSIGTGYMLFTNGVMLGTFQYLFYKYGLLYTAFKVIWIHGSFEIFAIIVAGAAGIRLGNSLLFPGTYSRSRSFQTGVKQGLKIFTGLIPFFLVAAFLEGFVTRRTEMPEFLSLSIIFLSIFFIFFYFYYYPKKLKKQIK